MVYDPNGGFLTGDGWIDSAAGAYMIDPKTAGKALFKFEVKYQKGDDVPTGHLEFTFADASLNFKSSSFEWLVVPEDMAQCRGVGTINDAGNYGFVLVASDGQMCGNGGLSKLRMKIWERKTGKLIYDNDVGYPENIKPTTVISGGRIDIHFKGKGKNKV